MAFKYHKSGLLIYDLNFETILLFNETKVNYVVCHSICWIFVSICKSEKNALPLSD